VSAAAERHSVRELADLWRLARADKVWPRLEGEAARWMRLTMRDGTLMDFRREDLTP
jgi:hypothetical protein